MRSLNATLNIQDEEDANFDRELFSDLALSHRITEFVVYTSPVATLRKIIMRKCLEYNFA